MGGECRLIGGFGGNKIRCECPFCCFKLEVLIFKMAISGVFLEVISDMCLFVHNLEYKKDTN